MDRNCIRNADIIVKKYTVAIENQGDAVKIKKFDFKEFVEGIDNYLDKYPPVDTTTTWREKLTKRGYFLLSGGYAQETFIKVETTVEGPPIGLTLNVVEVKLYKVKEFKEVAIQIGLDALKETIRREE